VVEPVIIGNATEKWTAIYAFEDHGGEVRYVGKTTQYLIDRRKAHLRPKQISGRLPVNIWLRKRKDAEGFVTRLLEHVPPFGDWAAREKHWIKFFRERGDRLLNLTDGGEGLPGHKFTDEHKAKIAAALRKGKTHACAVCGVEFYRKPKDAKAKNLFCSRQCANTFNKGGHRYA